MTDTMKPETIQETGSVGAVNLSSAVRDPASAFDRPNDVAACESLSLAVRRRLLELWEADVRAQMREEDEGGQVRTTRAHLLEEIRAAMSTLSGGERAAQGH